ncbi:D-Ala-D-Ala carboxypeptidase family metallohydrolase [Psychrobacter sp.]|uniref:D-Ala-D-Ala carboxypeptidase family metallohydrolase n=1 Tax=Psychrobacter sp. TaxID=56811 RepID=UPI0025D914BD|nr:D-Ala-D-Ala carboxypeptidase family metallohydrolase [Psychrobacter sp.]
MISIIRFPLGIIFSLTLLAASCTPVAEKPATELNKNSKTTPIVNTNNTANKNYKVITRQNDRNDRLGSLIKDAEQAYKSDHLTIQQNTTIRPLGTGQQPRYSNQSNSFGEINYNYTQWLNLYPYRANDVAQYKRYLANYLGEQAVPPLDELLTSARSWERCGYEQYQLPPNELWSNMVPTLKLYEALKSQGVIPATAEIRSSYRSPALNACAGGADASKHMTNGAIDIWVPEYEGQPWYKNSMQDRLCQFWANQGQNYNFGLGLYATGAIHLDTQGYRYWGTENSQPGSYCRYLN